MKYSLFIETSGGKIKSKGLIELDSFDSLLLEKGEAARYLLPPATLESGEARAKRFILKDFLIRDALFVLSKTSEPNNNWDKGNFWNCLNESFDTYTDLLAENGNLSNDERDSAEAHFKRMLFDQNPELLTLSELTPFKRLHPLKFDDGYMKREGVIVVMIDPNGKGLVLDGNHRLNSESDPNLNVWVVKVIGVIYPKEN
jgi:hypothetical protein